MADPVADPASAPSITVPEHEVAAPVVGDGPVHSHAVTYASWFGVVCGIALLVAGFLILGKHMGSFTDASTFFMPGIGLVVAGAGGAAFGKSPAIR